MVSKSQNDRWLDIFLKFQGSAPSKEEIDQLYAKLNQCKITAVTLSLIDPFADQYSFRAKFLLESRLTL